MDITINFKTGVNDEQQVLEKVSQIIKNAKEQGLNLTQLSMGIEAAKQPQP